MRKVEKFRAKLSQPVIDRIDLKVFLSPYDKGGDDDYKYASLTARRRIQNSRNIQRTRYKDEWNNHPDALAHFPSLLDQTKCKTGRYYWDTSLNKAVEITEDTDKDILESHPDYDTDENGNFDQSWTNENAEELLAGLLAGVESGWDNDDFNGIRVADLQTGVGSYGTGQGITRHKGKNPEDKRKKQWTTTFYYTNGESETLIGYWDRLSNGRVRRVEWKE